MASLIRISYFEILNQELYSRAKFKSGRPSCELKDNPLRYLAIILFLVSVSVGVITLVYYDMYRKIRFISL